jgi:arabinofuranosyltransferase
MAGADAGMITRSHSPAARFLATAVWPMACGILALTLLVIGILRTAWLSDDGLIIIRSVLNLLHGYGPVWNIDERVQAFTCPLWFLLMALATTVSGEPFITTIVVSILVTLAAVALLAVPAWRAAGWTWGLALALLGLALSRCYVEFATSGLEAPLSCLLIAALGLALERQRTGDLVGGAIVVLMFSLA